mgnify:FL=1
MFATAGSRSDHHLTTPTTTPSTHPSLTMQLFPVALLALASVAVAQLQNIHLEGQPLLEAFASRRPGALVDLYLLAGVLAPADVSLLA